MYANHCSALLLAGLFAANAFAVPFTAEETTVITGASPIRYFLRRPKVKAFPLIFVVQGSQCESAVNHPVIEAVPSEAALLMIEKPGLGPDVTGCPQAYLEQNTVDRRIDDAMRVLDRLERQLAGWTGRLLVIGGSEGGVIAAEVAARRPVERLALLVTGGSMNLAEALPLAQKQQMQSYGAEPDTIAAMEETFARAFDAIRAEPNALKTWGGDTNTYRYWSSILWRRPVEAMLKHQGPLLLLHGTRDHSHPVESARQTRDRFLRERRTNLTYWELEGLDHDLVNAAGESQMQRWLSRCFQWLMATDPKS